MASLRYLVMEYGEGPRVPLKLVKPYIQLASTMNRSETMFGGVRTRSFLDQADFTLGIF